MLLAFTGTTKTLIVAIVGIGVSGVLGPMATARATRKANRAQFEQDQRAKQRDDLRTLVDEAAKLLGAGVTNLRRAREARQARETEPHEVKQWASDVHLLRQRLLLRKGEQDMVLTSYAGVLASLEQVAEARGEQDYEAAVGEYRAKMDTFLAAARSSLETRVS